MSPECKPETEQEHLLAKYTICDKRYRNKANHSLTIYIIF